MRHLEITRRGFLGAAIAASVVVIAPAPAAFAVPAGNWGLSQSENGWPVLDQATIFRIEGCNQSVSLADGDSAIILLYVARRFNYEIGTLLDGEISGHTTNRAIGHSYESNYLSGTAIAVRPALYPAGASGLLYPNELAVVRDIVAELNGVVTWGGDEAVAKESHFQIARAPGHPLITSAARKIRSWDQTPGRSGAGAVSAFGL